jgi:N-formylglutamate deformylase
MPIEIRDLEIEGVLRLHAPHAEPLPLSFDSPHSGTRWPADFRPSAPEAIVRRTEDSFVDELFEAAPRHGTPLLAATFPRIYIDPNRALDDLDPELLDGPWPTPLRPGEKTALGKGLIWRVARPEVPIYAGPLTVPEVEARVRRYWQPYQVVLGAMLDVQHRRFGSCWHINCHSMKSLSTAMDAEGPGKPRPDIVLSDREGSTCAPAFTEAAAGWLRGRGLAVAINRPFKGAEIVRRHGRPGEGRHALQIEINRRLYMDEGNLTRGEPFAAMRDLVGGFIEAMAAFVRSTYSGPGCSAGGGAGP